MTKIETKLNDSCVFEKWLFNSLYFDAPCIQYYNKIIQWCRPISLDRCSKLPIHLFIHSFVHSFDCLLNEEQRSMFFFCICIK